MLPATTLFRIEQSKISNVKSGQRQGASSSTRHEPVPSHIRVTDAPQGLTSGVSFLAGAPEFGS